MDNVQNCDIYIHMTGCNPALETGCKLEVYISSCRHNVIWAKCVI
jgi:hypothetical protein